MKKGNFLNGLKGVVFLVCSLFLIPALSLADTYTGPHVVGSLDFDGEVRDVFVFGNYAYIAAEEAGLILVDISDPTKPKYVNLVDTDYALGVYVSGSYAYVADGEAGLKVIDISNPNNPSIVGSVNTYDALDVYVAGSYAYVVDRSAGLKIIWLGSSNM